MTKPTPSPAPASGAETCKHRHAYGCTCGYCITGGCTPLHAKPARPTPPSDAGTSERETAITTAPDALEPHFTPFHAAAPAAEGPRARVFCSACGDWSLTHAVGEKHGHPCGRGVFGAHVGCLGCAFCEGPPAAALPGAEAGTPQGEVCALADMIELRGHQTANPNYLRAAELLRDYDAECKDAEFWRGEAARLAALTSEVRALREDKARLDWLCDEARCAPVTDDHLGPLGVWLVIGARVNFPGELRDDFRTAIDAARLASPSPTGAPSSPANPQEDETDAS